jgi:transcriptional regulator with XRE-family HTH domain
MSVKAKQAMPRAYSRQGREAVMLLGQLIRMSRIERKLTVEELATRVGISRDMMRRIESGDLRCGIGLVFEAAVIVGVPLFEEDRDRLSQRRAEQETKLRLLPKAVRKPRREASDDF